MSEQKTSRSGPASAARQQIEAEYKEKRAGWHRFYKVNGNGNWIGLATTTAIATFQLHRKLGEKWINMWDSQGIVVGCEAHTFRRAPLAVRFPRKCDECAKGFCRCHQHHSKLSVCACVCVGVSVVVALTARLWFGPKTKTKGSEKECTNRFSPIHMHTAAHLLHFTLHSLRYMCAPVCVFSIFMLALYLYIAAIPFPKNDFL